MLVVIMLGTLWGLVEILAAPTYVYCVTGIFVLALLIGLYGQTGYCLAAGIIACLFKTLYSGFMMCQWAGILSLAFSAEVVLLFYLSVANRPFWFNWLCGVSIAVLAWPLFTFWVTEVMQQPFWVDAGWSRIGDYAMDTTLPAALIGGLIFPLAIKLGESVRRFNWRRVSIVDQICLFSATLGLWLGNAV